MQLLLPEDLIKKSGSTDPILYYRRRLGIGRVFRRRIEMGLEMIPPLVFDGNRTRRFRTASVCVNDAI